MKTSKVDPKRERLKAFTHQELIILREGAAMYREMCSDQARTQVRYHAQNEATARELVAQLDDFLYPER